MWFENECGESYIRQENVRMAFKMFNFVKKHFDNIYEDQFDFHLYSLRKSMMRAYMNLLHMEEDLYNHAFYRRATIGYLKSVDYLLKNMEKTKKTWIIENDEWLEEEEKRKKKSGGDKPSNDDDEEDEYRKDNDLKGFTLLKEIVRNIII